MLTATDNEIIAKAVAAALRSMNYKPNNVPDANRPNKGNNKCTICNCDSCEAELWAKESGKDIEEECLMLCDGNPIESPPHDTTSRLAGAKRATFAWVACSFAPIRR